MSQDTRFTENFPRKRLFGVISDSREYAQWIEHGEKHRNGYFQLDWMRLTIREKWWPKISHLDRTKRVLSFERVKACYRVSHIACYKESRESQRFFFWCFAPSENVRRTAWYSSQVHYKFWSLGHSHSILKPESLSRSLKTLSRGSAEKRTRFCAYLQGAEFLRSPVRKVHLRCERLPDGSVQMNTVIDSRTVCREFLSWCYGVTYRRFVPFVCWSSWQIFFPAYVLW